MDLRTDHAHLTKPYRTSTYHQLELTVTAKYASETRRTAPVRQPASPIVARPPRRHPELVSSLRSAAVSSYHLNKLHGRNQTLSRCAGNNDRGPSLCVARIQRARMRLDFSAEARVASLVTRSRQLTNQRTVIPHRVDPTIPSSSAVPINDTPTSARFVGKPRRHANRRYETKSLSYNFKII